MNNWRRGQRDLEAMEMALRSAVHRAGAAALSALLEGHPPAAEQRTLPCGCGQQARYRELRSKSLLTALGRVELRRPYYLCSHCQKGQFPLDQQLDVEDNQLSPGVRRMLAVVGSEVSFVRGQEQMGLLAGLEVTAKAVERTAEAIGEDIAAQEQALIGQAHQLSLPLPTGDPIPTMYIQMDGTQVPVVASETQGRAGRSEGQPSRTREAKLGCVFTQTAVDQDGYAIREESSTTYTGAIETAEEFGRRIFTEAWLRGWERAEWKVIIADGADWIWNLSEVLFPGAIQIVDLYHAREHLWDLARLFWPADPALQKRWVQRYLRWLERGQIPRLVQAIRKVAEDRSDLAETFQKEAAYFEKNAERMRYPLFRSQGLFVGSGVIEAGCRTVIGSRLKQSGMFWTVRGANAMIALCCSRSSGEFDEYWEKRAA
jgi:hypothetical protein